jgi:hypothetical protein
LAGKEVEEWSRLAVVRSVAESNNTAVLEVQAEVCLRCGERLYSVETVRQFEQVRAKLERGQVEEFQPLGQSFKVA